MVSGAQGGYQGPPQSSGGFPQQQSRQPQTQQNASSHQAPPPPPFTGFKLGGSSAAPSGQARRGGANGPAKRWTVAQLRASDAIIPLQSGTNQFASQRGMTGFGSPRNTTTAVYGGSDIHNPHLNAPPPDTCIPLQYGTNQFASQRGMTGFGQPRDVTGKHLHRLEDEDAMPGGTGDQYGNGGQYGHEQPEWQQN